MAYFQFLNRMLSMVAVFMGVGELRFRVNGNQWLVLRMNGYHFLSFQNGDPLRVADKLLILNL